MLPATISTSVAPETINKVTRLFNGSVNDIAGIQNARGNVLGMMPHPDRAFEAELGSADGAVLFQSIYAAA